MLYAKLQKLLGDNYLVSNFGASGTTVLAKGHRPYQKSDEYQKALDFYPDVVVFELGLNDTDPRNWPDYGDEFIYDYQNLVLSFKNREGKLPQIYICRMTPIFTGHPRFKSGTRDWFWQIQTYIEKVASNTGATLIVDKRGEILYDHVSDYYDFLEKNKVVGAFICGSTGEGVSLTQKEKMKLVEAWTAKSKEMKTVKVISLLGGTSYKECIDNAQHAASNGVDGVALIAPFYFKPASAKQLAEFCARVAESVPQMPLYFYHIPVLSGCFVNMYDFLQEAAPIIPNLAGIKYTHEDFMDFLSCIHFMNGKYDMMWGRDENMLSALVLGCHSGVGSTYNYAAPLYYKMIDAFDKGDLPVARRLQQVSIDMIRLLGKYGGIATGKAYMKYVGLDCGQFRSPVINMSANSYEKFVEDVQSLNMQELFSAL